MENLAGSERADMVVWHELSAAGASVVDVPTLGGEVRTRYLGVKACGGHVLTCVRAWVYYVVHCSPPLPVEMALKVDATRFVEKRTHYSGDGDVLGDVARADGFAGGRRPTEPVDCWHVDSPEGLRVLLQRVSEVVNDDGKPEGA